MFNNFSGHPQRANKCVREAKLCVLITFNMLHIKQFMQMQSNHEHQFTDREYFEH